MTTKKGHFSRALVSVCVAVILVIAGATAAYAADLGGFRQAVTLWWNGGQVEVSVEKKTNTTDGGDYYVITNPDGSTRHIGATAGEGENAREVGLDKVQHALAEYDADAAMDENGRIQFTIRANKVDITDQIEETGYYAHVKVEDGDRPQYFTIVWDKQANQMLCIAPDYEDFPDAERLWKNMQSQD